MQSEILSLSHVWLIETLFSASLLYTYFVHTFLVACRLLFHVDENIHYININGMYVCKKSKMYK